MVLPTSVVSRSDISRLLREVAAVDDFLRQAAVRTTGASMQLPRSSRLLEELASINGLNLLQEPDRHLATRFLQVIKSQAPVLHMSFSADPSPLFTQKLVTYIRREIHPLALVSTGLQPTIGAGCILRTSNKYFDFSLRQRFLDKRGLLLERLRSNDQPMAGGQS